MIEGLWRSNRRWDRSRCCWTVTLSLSDFTLKDKETYLFNSIAPNVEIERKNFEKGAMPANWKVVVNPPMDENPEAIPAGPGAPAPPKAAAMRGPRLRPQAR